MDRGPRSDEIRHTPEDQLQAKAREPYFARTLALAPGEVYLGPPNLNREHGRLAEPHVPVLRAATPIIDPDSGPPG